MGSALCFKVLKAQLSSTKIKMVSRCMGKPRPAPRCLCRSFLQSCLWNSSKHWHHPLIIWFFKRTERSSFHTSYLPNLNHFYANVCAVFPAKVYALFVLFFFFVCSFLLLFSFHKGNLFALCRIQAQEVWKWRWSSWAPRPLTVLTVSVDVKRHWAWTCVRIMFLLFCKVNIWRLKKNFC